MKGIKNQGAGDLNQMKTGELCIDKKSGLVGDHVQMRDLYMY